MPRGKEIVLNTIGERILIECPWGKNLYWIPWGKESLMNALGESIFIECPSVKNLCWMPLRKESLLNALGERIFVECSWVKNLGWMPLWKESWLNALGERILVECPWGKGICGKILQKKNYPTQTWKLAFWPWYSSLHFLPDHSTEDDQHWWYEFQRHEHRAAAGTTYCKTQSPYHEQCIHQGTYICSKYAARWIAPQAFGSCLGWLICNGFKITPQLPGRLVSLALLRSKTDSILP